MIKLTTIKNRINTLESKIISNGSGSNEDTFRLFANIGEYEYLEGKEDFIRNMKFNGMLERFTTEKAKSYYVMNAINYSKACKYYLAFERAHRTKLKMNKHTLLLPDLILYVLAKVKSMLTKDGIDIHLDYIDLQSFNFYINGVKKTEISNIKFKTTEQVEQVYLCVINHLFHVKFETYMLDILNEMIDEILDDKKR